MKTTFLQRDFNKQGEENFSFSIEFQGDTTEKEIGEKEKEFIKKYDSYHNGYNQNEGGNFGASNGGSHLTKADIFNILATLEFCSKPGQVLADMFEVSRTTISRIKKGISHSQYKDEYETLSLEDRKAIYKIFCESSNFYEIKIKQTINQRKRCLTKEQVFLILINYERKILPLTQLKEKVNIKSTNTFSTILKGLSYKDFFQEYNNLTQEEKEKIASQLSN